MSPYGSYCGEAQASTEIKDTINSISNDSTNAKEVIFLTRSSPTDNVLVYGKRLSAHLSSSCCGSKIENLKPSGLYSLSVTIDPTYAGSLARSHIVLNPQEDILVRLDTMLSQQT